jgi:phosphatidylserine/phosphatidylglycerophosphate/cardiolipin synthase-like enzyme
MSARLPLGVTAGTARLVPDDAYPSTLLTLVAGAQLRCLCSIFLVDLTPLRDRKLIVDGVLRELAAAAWRGVDVRLLIGGSRDNIEIAEASDVARARALQLGLDCRWATSSPIRGSHAKLAVIDDEVLTGSHNWSVGAFTGQTQDSVRVSSPALAACLTDLFERQWAAAARAS